MKPLPFAALALGFALSGCMTLNEADRAVLQKHRISPDLHARMLRRQPLSPADIMELAEKRVPSSFTVRYLRGTGAVYHLTTDDVLLLRRAGVGKPVIDHLLASPALYAPMVDPFWDYHDPFWWPEPLPIRHYHPSHSHHRHCRR